MLDKVMQDKVVVSDTQLSEVAEKMLALTTPSPLTDFKPDWPGAEFVSMQIKRDDLIHPIISGNKWRKLQHNLARAKQQGYSKLLTFGGAFSNHLAAVASAGHHFGFQTIGLVRGEAVENPTLELAQRNGMELHFISRTAYRRKQEADFLQNIKMIHLKAKRTNLESMTNKNSLPLGPFLKQPLSVLSDLLPRNRGPRENFSKKNIFAFGRDFNGFFIFINFICIDFQWKLVIFIFL